MNTQPKLTPEMLLTPEVKSYVNAYLMARAYAETVRERINAIHLQILTECPIYSDRYEGRGVVEEPRQILRSKDLYLCTNDALCKDFYAEANKRERECGLKPASIEDGYCPALVAERLQMQIEHKLVEASGRLFGVTVNSLLCAAHGLERLAQWIDLVVQMVANSPDFKNPLTV